MHTSKHNIPACQISYCAERIGQRRDMKELAFLSNVFETLLALVLLVMLESKKSSTQFLTADLVNKRNYLHTTSSR